MTLEEAKERSQELYDLAATLNAKTKEAQVQGLNVAMFIHDAVTGPAVVVNVSISPNKITA